MKDNQLLVFNGGERNFNRFLKTLKQQKRTDVWRRCYVKEIKVHPLINNPIGLQVLRREMNFNCDDQILIESMESNKALILQFPLEKMMYVPIRDIALTSLFGRCRISGNVLRQMSNEDLAKVLNICLQQYDDLCLILYRDYKISAIHSGDNSDYCVLIPYDLINTLKQVLDRKFKGYSFLSAFLTHEMCCAEFELKESKIIETYKPYLKNLGYERHDKFKPMIRFTTSDTATCGANISPFLRNGDLRIQVAPALSVKHMGGKNGKSLECFKANAESIFSLFQAASKKFEHLSETVLMYPIDCFFNVCSKIGISNTYASDAGTDFENLKPRGATALDLYMALWEIIVYMKNNKEPENKIFIAQEKIARVLTLEIGNYDKRRELR